MTELNATQGAGGGDRMSTEEVEVRSSPDSVHRTLVLAHEGLGGEQLIALLDRHQADQGDRPNEVFVVVPALSGPLKQLANDNQDERAAALRDLERLLAELEADGRRVGGLVGDPDPRLALEDSLRQFAADEIVVVNPGDAEISGSEEAGTERALDDVPLPVVVLSS